MSSSQNFSPAPASDNTAGPVHTPDTTRQTDNFMRDLGPNYLSEVPRGGTSGPNSGRADAGTDAQTTLNAGLQTTDQLYGPGPAGTGNTDAPTIGVGRTNDTGNNGDGTATTLTDQAPRQSSDAELQSQSARADAPPSSRPEMSMARSAGGG